MTQIESSYLAGLTDGEGCITLISQRRGNGSLKVFPNVNICNTYKPVIEWIRTKTKMGSVRLRKRSGKHKDNYEIHFRVNEILPFLDIVQPYLLVKERQAILMREFYQVKGDYGDNEPISLEIHTRRVELLYRIQELNRKGDSDTD